MQFDIIDVLLGCGPILDKHTKSLIVPSVDKEMDYFFMLSAINEFQSYPFKIWIEYNKMWCLEK